MELLHGQCARHSRPVMPEDMERVKLDALEMLKLCGKPMGKYPFAYAISHCQVNHDDPLRFFVLADGGVIINPKIKAKVGEEVLHQTEGCYSYPFRPPRKMTRARKILVEYYVIYKPKLRAERLKKMEKEVEDLASRIFQHEIDHMNGKAIY